MGATWEEVREFTAGGHPVVTGPAALHALQAHLEQLGPVAKVVLGDRHTLALCLPELLAHVPVLRGAPTMVIEPGEASKRVEVCTALWQHMVQQALDRRAVLLCLGGGVVTDVGGFVAGAYKRGIRCVHVPTSLLAMVDAAIGGKTGVDLDGVKNVVGVFHDPLGTYVHVPFLRTLGKRELLNGVAEMIKHGLVRDAAHFEALCQAPLHDLDALEALVARSAAIKAEVVSEDPRESGTRKLLNFGHTIGHAVESFSWEGDGRALLHGEAVAIGMWCEAWLSHHLGMLAEEEMLRITSQLHQLYAPYALTPEDDHRILELMRNDKKNTDGAFRFTLLQRIGEGRVGVPASADDVRQALEAYRRSV